MYAINWVVGIKKFAIGSLDVNKVILTAMDISVANV